MDTRPCGRDHVGYLGHWFRQAEPCATPATDRPLPSRDGVVAVGALHHPRGTSTLSKQNRLAPAHARPCGLTAPRPTGDTNHGALRRSASVHNDGPASARPCGFAYGRTDGRRSDHLAMSRSGNAIDVRYTPCLAARQPSPSPGHGRRTCPRPATIPPQSLARPTAEKGGFDRRPLSSRRTGTQPTLMT